MATRDAEIQIKISPRAKSQQITTFPNISQHFGGGDVVILDTTPEFCVFSPAVFSIMWEKHNITPTLSRHIREMLGPMLGFLRGMKFKAEVPGFAGVITKIPQHTKRHGINSQPQ